jgi:hypothetical protein
MDGGDRPPRRAGREGPADQRTQPEGARLPAEPRAGDPHRGRPRRGRGHELDGAHGSIARARRRHRVRGSPRNALRGRPPGAHQPAGPADSRLHGRRVRRADRPRRNRVGAGASGKAGRCARCLYVGVRSRAALQGWMGILERATGHRRGAGVDEERESGADAGGSETPDRRVRRYARRLPRRQRGSRRERCAYPAFAAARSFSITSRTCICVSVGR